MPSYGRYAPSATDSGALSNPAPAQAVQDKKYTYSQPTGQKQPNAAAPVPPGYAFQPATIQEGPSSWAVDPPRLPSGSAQRVSSGPDPLASSYVSPYYPQYQGGELSKYEGDFEHSNSESETETSGFQPYPYFDNVQAQPQFTSDVQPPFYGRSWPFLPYPYDYMFMTGQYPAGTFTHSSQSSEQGADQWQDSHYIRDHFPRNRQAEMVPELKAPQTYKQPSQSVAQSTGSVYYPYQRIGQAAQ
ncbi:uncharacterized protein LOC132985233 [Labrus mixtus]|uniref:uncharacterized protein LOC132985233 n=1 Tax=Labrus mixtus TaxID=508554 RepID=UPI0029C06A82|nr:uncharacterized protein LOC132985233 [Labrus mixtus]